MTSAELIFTAIIVVTAAALAGVWLSIRPPKSSEQSPAAEQYPEHQPPPPARPATRARKTVVQEQQPKSRQQPQSQASQPQKPKQNASPQPRQEEGQGLERGGPKSGQEAAAEQAQPRTTGGRLDEEAVERLEETLRLYSDLLQEMESLKRRLSEKLS